MFNYDKSINGKRKKFKFKKITKAGKVVINNHLIKQPHELYMGFNISISRICEVL